MFARGGHRYKILETVTATSATSATWNRYRYSATVLEIGKALPATPLLRYRYFFL